MRSSSKSAMFLLLLSLPSLTSACALTTDIPSLPTVQEAEQVPQKTTTSKIVTIDLKNESIAGIAPKMSEKEFQAKSPPSELKVEKVKEQDKLILYRFDDGLNVGLRKKSPEEPLTVEAIFIESGAYGTAKGIKLGMDESEVLAVYGEPSVKQSNSDGTWWCYYSQDGIELSFVLNSEKVKKIYLQTGA
ncbi:hypothetical protein H1S01_02920 [Heliobacterium chlorum]|uniref:Lipoprotein n=1 Tax=Heliobacterium chlorum TaxID=2698 RepID=A0ABR7SZN6_HELCL|nr:hypothetical protein [Heliobacterium chlorum]MBC9783465.1 hypothetical protein [Heliobacterium chlorum]